MKAYFIATANDCKKDELGWLDWGKSHRVVGFYEDLETANDFFKKAIESYTITEEKKIVYIAHMYYGRRNYL